MTVQFLELKRIEYHDLRAEIKRLENELGVEHEKQSGDEIGSL